MDRNRDGTLKGRNMKILRLATLILLPVIALADGVVLFDKCSTGEIRYYRGD
jgi:hypothetical protein